MGEMHEEDIGSRAEDQTFPDMLDERFGTEGEPGHRPPDASAGVAPEGLVDDIAPAGERRMHHLAGAVADLAVELGSAHTDRHGGLEGIPQGFGIEIQFRGEDVQMIPCF
jgi:hypothetical protein